MQSPSSAEVRHDLVLVGGGHSHIQVLRRWAMEPVPGVRLTVVVDQPVAVYSGMVPGFVAGQYSADQLEIDVRPLAMRAGARTIVAAMTGLHADARRIDLAGRPPLPYDTVSFDVGSTVAGLELPGVAEHTLATRPIGRFVQQVEAALARLAERPTCRVVVVGAGAGGTELAFALDARLRGQAGREPHVLLLETGPHILPGYAPAAVRRVQAAAARRGIAIRSGAEVARVTADAVLLEGGERLEADLVAWVAGAASLAVFAGSGLDLDPEGFVRVGPTLQSPGRPEVFAVGDCASWTAGPALPKAGVYAVRQGPVLADNLRERLTGFALRPYRPQRDFLSLLNLGDGTAIGTKWGRAVEGEWVFRLKDWIDLRFMRRFQVLDAEGELTAEFTGSTMPAGEMLCGGCAAKVGESSLTRALSRLDVMHDPAVVLGLAVPDDAAAVATPRGEIVATTVDSFRAFADDPFLVGNVAAVNAASDLWAKGVTPRFALAQVNIAERDPDRAEETLYQVMAGARAAFDPEGITLVGGHTTIGPELTVGFSLFGFASAAEALIRISGLAPGDRLVLTKALGTGVLLQGDMRGLARGDWVETALASMRRTNAAASKVAIRFGSRAATDVTGFGLAGHLGEMLRASGVSARLELGAVPLLPGVASLLAQGLRSTAHPENVKARRAIRVAPVARELPELDALFDPQTSGGLLFGVAPERAEEAVAALRAGGDGAAGVIGEVLPPRTDGALFEVVLGGLL